MGKWQLLASFLVLTVVAPPPPEAVGEDPRSRAQRAAGGILEPISTPGWSIMSNPDMEPVNHNAFMSREVTSGSSSGLSSASSSNQDESPFSTTASTVLAGAAWAMVANQFWKHHEQQAIDAPGRSINVMAFHAVLDGTIKDVTLSAVVNVSSVSSMPELVVLARERLTHIVKTVEGLLGASVYGDTLYRLTIDDNHHRVLSPKPEVKLGDLSFDATYVLGRGSDPATLDKCEFVRFDPLNSKPSVDDDESLLTVQKRIVPKPSTIGDESTPQIDVFIRDIEQDIFCEMVDIEVPPEIAGIGCTKLYNVRYKVTDRFAPRPTPVDCDD